MTDQVLSLATMPWAFQGFVPRFVANGMPNSAHRPQPKPRGLREIRAQRELAGSGAFHFEISRENVSGIQTADYHSPGSRYTDVCAETGHKDRLCADDGRLHAGHASLMERARAGRRGAVVVTIFVNPIQFDRKEDLRAIR